MIKKNQEKTTSKSFKTVIVLLSFTMLCSLFYIYKQSSISKNTILSLRKEKLEIATEKEAILLDLEKSKIYLEQALSSKSELSDQLNAEKIKINELIVQLKNAKNDNINSNLLGEYRNKANASETKIADLIKELNNYKKKVDSTNVILKNERVAIDTLKTSNKKLTTKVNEAAKLYFYDLKTSPVKIKSSGTAIETDKASRTDAIKISFMIAENDFAKPTNKDFYIQIIDSKNNVIGSKKTVDFGSQSLTYSAVTSAKYENKTIKIELLLATQNLEKGSFFINVFDKSKLILKDSIILK